VAEGGSRPGWFKAPNALVDHWMRFVGMQSACVLLIFLRTRKNRTMAVTELSQEEIGRMAGIKERQVRNLLQPLLERNLVEKVKRRGVNLYRLSAHLLAIDSEIESGNFLPDKRVINGPLFGEPQALRRKAGKAGNVKSGNILPVSAESGNFLPVSGHQERQYFAGESGNPLPVNKESGSKTKYKTENTASTTTVLDLKEATRLLAKIPPGVNPKGIERILAEILEVRPDVTTEEFEDRLQFMLTSKNIHSWSGFFMTDFADHFRGEVFEQVRQRLHTATKRQQTAATALTATKRQDRDECMCYPKRNGEIVICPACQRSNRKAAQG
jgi:hypothetical protein